MLSELRITDLGVIDEAIVCPDPGLTVVTGETGAGKTMIIQGITLLLGGKADSGTIRSDADRARVEAVLRPVAADLAGRVHESGGRTENDELLLARQVTRAGRSRAFLGGAQVPAAVSGELAAESITVYGQSEQVRLASAARQREVLDAYAGPELGGLLGRYGADYAQRRQDADELEQLRRTSRERAREIDMLRFGLDEIAGIAPQPGEDTELGAEAGRLQAADDLRQAASTAMLALAGDANDPEASGDAIGQTATAGKAIDRLAGMDTGAGELAGRVAEAGQLLADLAGDLSQYLDRLEASPGRLEQIAERRSQLAQLTRKYGPDVDDVLAWVTEANQQLTELENGDDRIDALAGRVAELDRRLDEQAAEITRLRTAAAGEVALLATAELADLAMPHGRVEFTVTETELGPSGRDRVELLFSANPGTTPQNLAKVASGGELSRLRLALEVVLAGATPTTGHPDPDEGPEPKKGPGPKQGPEPVEGSDQPGSTLIFDEVDAGVGGRVAVEIGRRLALLAGETQVIVVTHLAQVAAFADRHYVVDKSNDGRVTTSGVRHVTGDQRASELARMMGGIDHTESSIAHAHELLELAATSRPAPGAA